MSSTRILCALALACFGALALAADPADANKDGKFTPLFNGKNLDGWHGDKELWKVEEGCIVGSTDDKTLKKNSFLIFEKPYKNFVLKAKFKLRNHNSGIQFRSKEGDDYAVTGYQTDMAEKRYTGILHEEGGKTIVADVKEDEIKQHYKPGEWSEFVITADGPHIKQVLNGYTTIDFTDPDYETKPKDGILALQLHAGPKMRVDFKDIEIMELPDTK